MNYKESHEYLNSLLVFGIKLGLGNMEALCRLLGNPQKNLKFIHVAGTNGKGSCCAMMAAALKKSGLKTGFYSSPFLYRFTERWRIDGNEVSETQVADAITRIAALEPDLTKMTGVRPTYFEVLTAAALLIFKSAGVEAVVWETGMGGRLDATNVVIPVVSVITNIDLDHTQYLGDTLEKIAVEKGGIVKKGVPLICGETKPQIVEYFDQLAKDRQSESYFIGKDFNISSSKLKKNGDQYYREIIFSSAKTTNVRLKLPAIAGYQCENAAIAIAALQVVSEKLNLDFNEAVLGIESYIWPGRMELRKSGILLDGAHNSSGARALVEALDEMSSERKVDFICGILSDKNWQEVLDILAPKANSFYFVSIDNERASKVADLQSYVESKGVVVAGSGNSEEAVENIKRPERTVVVGSLYLIGEVLSILNNGEPALIDSL